MGRLELFAAVACAAGCGPGITCTDGGSQLFSGVLEINGTDSTTAALLRVDPSITWGWCDSSTSVGTTVSLEVDHCDLFASYSAVKQDQADQAVSAIATVLSNQACPLPLPSASETMVQVDSGSLSLSPGESDLTLAVTTNETPTSMITYSFTGAGGTQ